MTALSANGEHGQTATVRTAQPVDRATIDRLHERLADHERRIARLERLLLSASRPSTDA